MDNWKNMRTQALIIFGFYFLEERPSERIEAKLFLILSTLDAIERHISIDTFKGHKQLLIA